MCKDDIDVVDNLSGQVGLLGGPLAELGGTLSAHGVEDNLSWS